MVRNYCFSPRSRPPDAPGGLMLVMEMGKDSSRAKCISLQPRKGVVRYIHQDFMR